MDTPGSRFPFPKPSAKESAMIRRTHLAASLQKLVAALDDAKDDLKDEKLLEAETCLADAVLTFAYAIQSANLDSARRSVRLKLHRQ
jgi:hypothetical protein